MDTDPVASAYVSENFVGNTFNVGVGYGGSSVKINNKADALNAIRKDAVLEADKIFASIYYGQQSPDQLTYTFTTPGALDGQRNTITVPFSLTGKPVESSIAQAESRVENNDGTIAWVPNSAITSTAPITLAANNIKNGEVKIARQDKAITKTEWADFQKAIKEEYGITTPLKFENGKPTNMADINKEIDEVREKRGISENSLAENRAKNNKPTNTADNKSVETVAAKQTVEKDKTVAATKQNTTEPRNETGDVVFINAVLKDNSLKLHYGSGVVANNKTQEQLVFERGAVKILQTQLNALGEKIDPINGELNAQTLNRVINMENRLAADGKLGIGVERTSATQNPQNLIPMTTLKAINDAYQETKKNITTPAPQKSVVVQIDANGDNTITAQELLAYYNKNNIGNAAERAGLAEATIQFMNKGKSKDSVSIGDFQGGIMGNRDAGTAVGTTSQGWLTGKQIDSSLENIAEILRKQNVAMNDDMGVIVASVPNRIPEKSKQV